MFPVKVFNAKGKLVKEVSVKEQKTKMWANFTRSTLGGITCNSSETTKVCAKCKKEFKTWNPKVRLCSKECKENQSRVQRKNSPARKRNKEAREIEQAKDKTCAKCGSLYHSWRKAKKFCTTRCNQSFHNRTSNESRKKRRAKGKE